MNPDTHDEEGRMDIYKGWLVPGDVLNTMNVDEVKTVLNRRKPS